jgi:hypothetical protein
MVATHRTAGRPRVANARSGGDASRTSAATESPNKRLIGSKDILLSLPDDLKERMANTITLQRADTDIVQQQSSSAKRSPPCANA